MSTKSIEADEKEKEKDGTVKLPWNLDQAFPWIAGWEPSDYGIVNFWDSDIWKEFCRLSFRTTDHDSVLSRVVSRDPSRSDGLIEETIDDERVPAERQDGPHSTPRSRKIIENTAGAPSDPVDGSDYSSKSIVIYLDEELKAIYMRSQIPSSRPGAMDMTPLENLRRKISDDEQEPEVGYQQVLDEYLDKTDESSDLKSPLTKLIDNLTAASKFLSARQQVSFEEVESVGVDSNSSCRIDMEPTRLMQQLASYNEQFTHVTDLPRVLANPVMTDLWVRERIQAKWHEKSTTARPVNQGTSNDAPPSHRSKRHLSRKLFDVCAAEVLTEVTQGLNASVVQPRQELSELQTLHDIHRHLLQQQQQQQQGESGGGTLVELISATEVQRTKLARLVSSEAPLIDSQAQALQGLMGMARRTSCALETRINRLSAKDVRDHEERRRVCESRLARPEALGYLSKAWQDLQLLRDQTRAVIAGLDRVDSELDGLGRRAAGLAEAQRACLLMVTMKDVRR
ncbi:MAG: hypothetical protein M1816_003978 [Peltula sp. TS41687]|nr:MAG: hypothetical protein M1816_003978 [Peltula sp. TS41687]